MARGLHAVGRISDIVPARPQPGPWCQSAPLWSNPLLDLESTPALAALAGWPGLRTLGDLAETRRSLPETPGARNPLRDAAERIWNATPGSWRAALPPLGARPRLDDNSPLGAAFAIRRLGWRSGENQKPVPLRRLSVRTATQLQTGGARIERDQSCLRYIRSATAEEETAATEPAARTLGELRTSLTALWGIAWEPQNKEALWRLINNGVSGAGGHDNPSNQPCPCGWSPPPTAGGEGVRQSAADSWRRHAFWTCPIAVAVRREITSCLDPTARLTCDNIWLLRPPHPLHGGVWLVVAAAALSAMDAGRRTMHQTHRQHQTDHNRTQTRITGSFPNAEGAVTTRPPGGEATPRAARKASARFWCHLQDFVDLGHPPPGDQAIPADHPFISMGPGNTIRLNLPPQTQG